MEPIDPRIVKFAEICDAHGFHGLLFQHLAICPRRTWLHLHRINYAHLEDRIARGKAAHEMSKARDKSVEGLFGLSPDRIDWRNRIVIEAKGRRGAVDAVSRQTMFYAMMLAARTSVPWRAVVEIISEKRQREISISSEDIDLMLEAAKSLLDMKSSPCPGGIDAPICQTCSYQYLCGRS